MAFLQAAWLLLAALAASSVHAYPYYFQGCGHPATGESAHAAPVADKWVPHLGERLPQRGS